MFYTMNLSIYSHSTLSINSVTYQFDQKFTMIIAYNFMKQNMKTFLSSD